LLGLAQFGLTVLAALIAVTMVKSMDVPSLRGSVLAWLIVWFVLGYTYATPHYSPRGGAGVLEYARAFELAALPACLADGVHRDVSETFSRAFCSAENTRSLHCG
jgi:hypothetical protein